MRRFTLLGFLLGILVFAALIVSSRRVENSGPAGVRPQSEASLPSPGATRDQSPIPIANPSANTATSVNSPASSATAAFMDWAGRYGGAQSSQRPSLVSEGVSLARARRPFLAELIRTDPASALASAVPRAARANLPEEVVAELEEIVSARAELEVIQSCLHPPGMPHDHADDFYRATVINDREYRVHTFGTRLRDASLTATSLVGIAIDRDLAISDARYRMVETGEPVAGVPLAAGEVAVEANGLITRLSSEEDLPEFIAAVVASEENPVIIEADGGTGSSGVAGRPTQAWTHGAKRLFVIRVDFSDIPGIPINKFDGNAQITPAYMESAMNSASGVRTFLQQNSFGKTDVLFSSVSNVTAVLRMPNTAASYATAGDSSLLHTQARALATSAGFNLDQYDRIAVVFSYLGDLPGSQMTYAGLGNVIGKNIWVNGEFDFRLVAHEFGHTYGLLHANLWQVSDGNPVSASGTSTEYGDPFDVMGGGDFPEYHFSHWNKSLLQWVPDTAVTVASSGGIYRVYRFDDRLANLAFPRALKIVRDDERDYWIGYRRGLNSVALDGGAYVLWGYNTAEQGNLLDLQTPGTNPQNAPLPLNQTFNDSTAGITITPIAQGGSGANEWLDIQVNIQSRIHWETTSYFVNEQGGSVVLTVMRTAGSGGSGSVSVNFATVPGGATSPADFTATNGTITWANGEMAPKTVVIPVVADALNEGSEDFMVTLSSPSGGVIGENPSATVTVGDPGSRDITFDADYINGTVYRVLVQPDSSLLIAGAFNLIQDTPGSPLLDYLSIARIKSNGGVDLNFQLGGTDGVIRALARQPDGKILIGGEFGSCQDTARNRIARLNVDGSLDATFDPGTGPNDTVYTILLQPDGKILVGGKFNSCGGIAREYLVRLNANGSVDPGFVGPDFGDVSGWQVEALALQADGRILVGGQFYFSGPTFKSGLCRVGTNGTLDATFTGVTNGAHAVGNTSSLRTIREIVVQPDAQILIGGSFTAFNNTARGGLARLTNTGAIDATFAPQPNNSVSALLRLPDGSILIGGDFTTVNGTTANRLAKITANGSLDTSFAANGGFDDTVQDFALQSDGNVVFASDIGSFQGDSSIHPLGRFAPGLSALPGTLQFSASAFTGLEGTSAALTVSRSGGSLGALTLGYATVAATATSGSDFTGTSGILAWADGDTSGKTITVPLTLDSVADGPESFLVNLGESLIGGVLLGDRQQATVTLSSAFLAWQAANFTAADLADPLISGDAADPDGDQLNNLTEFAFGLPPKIAGGNNTMSTGIQNVGGSDYLTITFRRRAPALDLAYTVESVGELAGVWAANAVQVGVALPNGDGTETVTYRDNVVASPNKRFLRVVVTRTP